MAVAGAEEGEVEGANACCCWSRRSSRGRDGDVGDVVVLDEARRGTQIFSTRPNDPDDVAAVLERDGEELVQLDEDHARGAQ